MGLTRKGLVSAVCGALLLASASATGAATRGDATPDANEAAQSAMRLKTAQIEEHDFHHKLDRSGDIKGPDANGNGIRDDIDDIIQGAYARQAQRRAAEQYAVVAQAELLVDARDATAVRALAVRSGRAINCLIQQFGTTQAPTFSDVQGALASDTTNTKARALAQLTYSKALGGAAISLPEGNTCD